MKSFLTLFLVLLGFQSFSQNGHPGLVIGSVLDEQSRALESATVQLTLSGDSIHRRFVSTDKTGSFSFEDLPFGFYTIRISCIGFQPLEIDSLNIRAARPDFNLKDLLLSPDVHANMEKVIVYAEKPLIESKDGNLTFNAGESALSASSNASELLANLPLVTKEPSGKITVRGKEPKILIDDKPVEGNAEQLLDILESLPGNAIEKIEVLVNPPPQYANEEGGVINIVTKKGTVGSSGRMTAYVGRRREKGGNGNFSYRNQHLALSLSAGIGYNEPQGSGFTQRWNTDGSQFFTSSRYQNNSLRPNTRANISYDPAKFHSLNLVVQYSENRFTDGNFTEYKNLDPWQTISRFSGRSIHSRGENRSPNASFTYTLKTRREGESLKLISNWNTYTAASEKNYYEAYYNPDHSLNGRDSTLLQEVNTSSQGTSVRLNYDLPLLNNTTFFSMGGYYTSSGSNMESVASYKKKQDDSWEDLPALNSHFLYDQSITNFRASVRQKWGSGLSLTTGFAAEQTRITFHLLKTASIIQHHYWNYLPFASLSQNWNKVYNLSFSYRYTVRRPGVTELNPTIDSSDQYNIQYGNPELLPCITHNFNLQLGKSRGGSFANVALGYNLVEDVFSRLRLTPTEISWQNISGRKEYEISAWSGFSLNSSTKMNGSAAYTFMAYSAFDRLTRNFRNGGSFHFQFNLNYVWANLYSVTGGLNFNRLANPQGQVRSSLSTAFGMQAKLLQKRLIVSLNLVDPFFPSQYRSFTYGTGFLQEKDGLTQTTNLRLSLAYVYNGSRKKDKSRVQSALKSLFPAFRKGS